MKSIFALLGLISGYTLKNIKREYFSGFIHNTLFSNEVTNMINILNEPVKPIFPMKPKRIEEDEMLKLLNDDNYYMDKKFDGHSVQILININNNIVTPELYSGGATQGYLTQHLPQIVEEIKILHNNKNLRHGDIIVGEMYTGKGESFDDRAGMGKLTGLPETAIEAQKETEWYKFGIFTIVHPDFPNETEEVREARLLNIKNDIGHKLKYVSFVEKLEDSKEKTEMYGFT